MLHVDTPTRHDIATLSAERADAALSLYLPTTPLTQDIGVARIAFDNLVKAAAHQLRDSGFDKRRLAALEEGLAHLSEDDGFWALQANSLAVFATPDRVVTFRLANRLHEHVEVSDRFSLKPLLRAVTFAHEAFVLAISENHVRLVEMFPDMPPVEIRVPGMPKDAASHAGKATLNDRTASTRLQASEGQRFRLMQFARAVDAALRPVLAGRDTPLIVAAADPLASFYASVNTYPHLLPHAIKVSPDHMKDHELAERATPVLDEANRAMIAYVRETFEARVGQGRTTTDVSDAARAATFGSIDTLLVDIDASVPGTIDDQGQVTFAGSAGPGSYDVVAEIASRTLATGGRVLAVRRDDIPGGGALAAILRYAG